MYVLIFLEVAQARGQINRAEKVPHEQQIHFFIKVSHLLQLRHLEQNFTLKPMAHSSHHSSQMSQDDKLT